MERVLATAYLLLSVGFVLFGFGRRELHALAERSVPLGEQRRASLTPRSLDAFVPRWLKFVVFGLMFASIVARPMANQFYPDRIADVPARSSSR